MKAMKATRSMKAMKATMKRKATRSMKAMKAPMKRKDSGPSWKDLQQQCSLAGVQVWTGGKHNSHRRSPSAIESDLEKAGFSITQAKEREKDKGGVDIEVLSCKVAKRTLKAVKVKQEKVTRLHGGSMALQPTLSDKRCFLVFCVKQLSKYSKPMVGT